MAIVFDDEQPKKIVFDDEKKPSLLTKGLTKYAQFMGPEGGYGASPANKLMSMVQKPFTKASEKIASVGGEKGFPKSSAAVGTGVYMIPQIATMLMGGGERPPATGPGTFTKGLMGQLESSSGSMPGSLEAAYKDPSLIFSKGTKQAAPLYQAAQKELPYEQTIFRGLAKHGDVVDKAVKTVDMGGKLEPQEALIARKSLDKVKKTMNPDAFTYYRDLLDKMAKGSGDIAKADPLFKRGLQAQSLRNILPQNKLGGASAFKMAIGPALAGIGSVAGPGGTAAGTALGAAALSPVVQGAGATGLGIFSRTDPKLLAAFMQYLKSRGNK